MKFTSLLVLTLGLLLFTSCDKAGNEADTAASQPQAARATSQPEAPATNSAYRLEKTAANDSVSLKDADSANTAALAFDRKIIRNANLTVEVASATDSQRKIVSIAESHQGFVVTSEATQKAAGDQTKPEITVNLVVRVPATQ